MQQDIIDIDVFLCEIRRMKILNSIRVHIVVFCIENKGKVDMKCIHLYFTHSCRYVEKDLDRHQLYVDTKSFTHLKNLTSVTLVVKHLTGKTSGLSYSVVFL